MKLAKPLWPLTAPGMPTPGRAFIELARAKGSQLKMSGGRGKPELLQSDDILRQVIYDSLYNSGSVTVNIQINDKVASRQVVSGHRWTAGVLNGDYQASPGPEPCKVMVISKMLTARDEGHRRCLMGDVGACLLETLRKYDAPDIGKWYVTSALKTTQLSADSSTLKPAWIEEFAHLLHQEIRLVNPDYILCLGSDALKTVLGKKMTLDKLRGTVAELVIDRRTSSNKPEQLKTIKVMACEHPNSVLKDPRKRPRFDLDVCRFVNLVAGSKPNAREEGLDHRVIRNELQLRKVIRDAEANNPSRIVAVDAEWHGQHPQNKGAYVRCIQFSWAHKCAACVALKAPGGADSFQRLVRDKNGKPLRKDGKFVWTTKGGGQVAIKLLRRYFLNKRVVGHFFNADLEWLVHMGLDLRPQFAAPARWEDCKTKGGWDTGSMAHATDETGIFNLTDQLLRHTTVPRYDVELDEWKARFCRENDLKPSQLEGYGECPDKVLYPYACLHGSSLVQLADGSWRQIKELVRTKYDGCVKALVRGRVKNCRVTNWHRASVGQKSWFRLETIGSERGKHGLLGPLLTPDHKVLTKRGKVRVDQLVPGRDSVATDELEFSAEQLSVLLGSLLGDGGFTRKNQSKIGFGFGQVKRRGAYADWKAECFRTHSPKLIAATTRRYALPFSKYLTQLSSEFPTHASEIHGDRKAVVTERLLAKLGHLGLAVWYQDDGSLVRDKRNGGMSSRIYAKLPADEAKLVVSWLTSKLGSGVRYNARSRFIQIGGSAFTIFHKIIQPYLHPVMAYKTPLPVRSAPKIDVGKTIFYAPLVDVVPWKYEGNKRGNGVRYCLTVPESGNFLTKAGFVSNCYDADGTRRLALKHAKRLDKDEFGNNCWEAFWITQRASPAALEITRTGLRVNRQRLDRLTTVYMQARDALGRKIRTWARWPELKLSSADHIRELLFGERYNKKDQQGNRPRFRPRGALSLYAMPAITTDKRPREWSQLIGSPAEADATPSTNKLALGILYREADKMQVWDRKSRKWVVKNCGKYIADIRNYRFVDQVLKSVLRKPKEVADEDYDFGDDPFEVDEDGNFIYETGLPGAICDDSRVRTFISQVKETGRWASARPPLMNLCFDSETEILTPRGWVKLPALTARDKVAQFAPETKRIEFVLPEQRQSFEYSGEMIQLSGEQVDQLLTPNHRCLLRRRRSGTYYEVTADRFPIGTDNRLQQAGEYHGGSKHVSKAKIRLIAAMQADGHYVGGHTGYGVSFKFSKRRKVQRLKQTLTELGVRYRQTSGPNGVTTFYLGKHEPIVAELKKLLGPDKKYGSWLLAWSQKSLRYLSAELPRWDGLSTTLSEYYSSVEENADWVQIVHCLTGQRANKKGYQPTNKRAKRHYCVGTPQPHKRRDFTEVTGVTKQAVSYTGKVYCVTVPSSYVLVRRNGKVVVSGNSKRREPDYATILGDSYEYPLRSIFEADEGYTFVEADYVGAELFGMAVLSGDPKLIEHCHRNQLPEDHPDYYDIHSNIAVLAFNLECEPTKLGLKLLGKSHLRIVAKSVKLKFKVSNYYLAC